MFTVCWFTVQDFKHMPTLMNDVEGLCFCIQATLALFNDYLLSDFSIQAKLAYFRYIVKPYDCNNIWINAGIMPQTIIQSVGS